MTIEMTTAEHMPQVMNAKGGMENMPLAEGNEYMGVFVRVQDSKLPKNLSQCGTWAARAFRDKGYKVENWVWASVDDKFQFIWAEAVVSAWQGEKAKFHWKKSSEENA